MSCQTKKIEAGHVSEIIRRPISEEEESELMVRVRTIVGEDMDT